MGVFFIPQENMKKDFSEVQGDDVVVLPAFGATLEEMQYLKDLGCQVVDTTCPWVSKVSFWESTAASTQACRNDRSARSDGASCSFLGLDCAG
mmetsp:Transcript_39590/g.157185  ORF Transcript_39590/g.157185 Transcript_39590/m.157185 type:complete len:93 (+) Transcript_39590:677-955(+)